MFEAVAREFGTPILAVPPTAQTPEAALRHLVVHLAADGLADPHGVDEAVTHLLKREALGPTVLGRGLALPHRFIRQYPAERAAARGV